MMNVAIEKRFVREDCRKLYLTTTDYDKMIAYLENAAPLGLKTSDLKDGE